MELDGIRRLAEPERLMGVGPRPGEVDRSGRDAERVTMPLQGKELTAELSTGSPSAATVAATGSTPTSGVSPVCTGAPRLAASSCAPRQTPK